MTALGIDASDKDPVIGWEAIQPARTRNAELVEAENDERIAWAKYEQAVDDYYEHHYGIREYQERMTELQEDAVAASLIKTEIYNRLNGTQFTVTAPPPEDTP